MSKNPSEKGMKGTKKDEHLHHEGEAPGQKKGTTVSFPEKKKRTVIYDEGQKFTSDEDIIKRRTA
jgi:hypothetical protein